MPSLCLDKTQALQTLQGLMERLTSPDLTAAEASDLRPRLHGLLEVLDLVHHAEDGASRRSNGSA